MAKLMYAVVLGGEHRFEYEDGAAARQFFDVAMEGVMGSPSTIATLERGAALLAQKVIGETWLRVIHPEFFTLGG